MPIQINPSKFPIWVGGNELRLGAGANDQTLNQVSNAQERLIQLLFEGVAKDQLSLVGASVGLTEIETTKFVEHLRPSLLDDVEFKNDGRAIDVRFAELVRLGFQTNQSPSDVLAKRAGTRIRIPELDRTGLNLLRTLSELGFRSFLTDDFTAVTSNDGGELGYPRAMVGVSRLSAARSLVEIDKSHVELNHPKGAGKSELQILSATHRITPSRYKVLESPWLAIEYQIDSVFVSGIMIPRITPCLGCRELWAAESNPNWATDVIQLSARGDHLDDGASLLMAVALACRNICRFFDSEIIESSNVIHVASRKVSESNCQFHPTCDCRN
jgi:hypothetical protein